jgi:riboflavin transporter FmnP
MADNKFDMFGQLRSYDENYTGMSANLILTLLAFVAVLWLLSNQTKEQSKLIRSVLLPIIFCILGFSITSYFYFFPLPAVSCLLAVTFMAFAYFKLKKQF